MTPAKLITRAVAERTAGIAEAGSKAAWIQGLLSATVETHTDPDTGVTIDAEVDVDRPEVFAGRVAALAPLVVKVRKRFVCPVWASPPGHTFTVGDPVVVARVGRALFVFGGGVL